MFEVRKKAVIVHFLRMRRVFLTLNTIDVFMFNLFKILYQKKSIQQITINIKI